MQKRQQVVTIPIVVQSKRKHGNTGMQGGEVRWCVVGKKEYCYSC